MAECEGLTSKDEALVNEAERRGWRLVLVSETKRPREHDLLYNGAQAEWEWLLGADAPPRLTRGQTTAGVGVLVHRSVEEHRGEAVLVTDTRCGCALPVSQRCRPPSWLWYTYLALLAWRHVPVGGYSCNRLLANAREYGRMGPVVVGGDWNAADFSQRGRNCADAAGRHLLRFADDNCLTIANTLGPLHGRPRVLGELTRRDIRRPGIHRVHAGLRLGVQLGAEPCWQTDHSGGRGRRRVRSDHLPLELEWLPPAPARAPGMPQSAQRP